MLAQMSGQILNGLIELKEFFNARITQIQTCFAKLSRSRIFRILPLPGVDQTGQPADYVFIKAECFANFTRRGSSAVSDDVRGHRRAQLAVTLVDVLNRAFALVSTRQIQIDIW